jgi:methyl coenzyme M reductase gamma subunit
VAGVSVRDVAHTEAAYVVDAQGYERALFVWPYRAEDVARTIRSLD